MNEAEERSPASDRGSAAGPEPDTRRASLREMVTDAIRYWEPRRLIYNGALAAVVIGYFIAGLPESRGTLTLNGLLFLFFLAVLANACYCGAYAADLFAQYSGFRVLWRRWRGLLLLLGIAFAAVITRFFALAFFTPPPH